MRNYRRRNASRRSSSSGMSDGTKVAIAIGVVAVGGIGYWLYTQSQAATTASAGGSSGGGGGGGGGTSVGGGSNQTFPAFTGGTSMPASGNQYEAGAGADAPLVATGS